MSVTNPSTALSNIAWRWGVLLCLLFVSLSWSNCRPGGSTQFPFDAASESLREPPNEQNLPDTQTSTIDSSTSLPPVGWKPTVLLISLDGFRWDYFNKADTPHLNELIQGGAKARSLIPVFPSKTFPNHYSIVTGLYPENHGIVSNSMYDPEFKEYFKITDSQATSDGKWWEGEPIWVTAVKQGQRSATMFWPGSDAAIQNTRPSYWRAYQGNLSHAERIQQLVRWLELPAEQRPTFLTLYLEDVDTAGHDAGPDSIAVYQAIQKVDQTLGTLFKELKQRGLFSHLNIVVTSDHGMTELSLDRRIFLSDYIDLNDVYINEISMVLSLNPKAGKEQLVYDQLKDKHPRLKVYKREEVPEHLHYRKHRRIGQIIGIAEEGWTVVIDKNYTSIYAASHGYDPAYPSMHGIFVAHGPAFKQGHTIDSFTNIHIYALMCHILKLTPAAHDGELSKVRDVLRSGTEPSP